MSTKFRIRLRRLGGAAAAAVVAVAAFTATPPSASAAASQVPATSVEHDLPAGRTASAAVSVEKFWTPQRMKSARLLDATVATGRMPSAARLTATVNTVRPAAYVPAELPPSMGLAAVGVTSTVGRVFFSDPNGSVDGCSGGSVTSEAGDMVLTAGHCVYGGSNFENDGKVPRGWYQNWVYVPGYYVDASGAAHTPYGIWAAWGAVTTPTWYYSNPADETQDVAVGLVMRNAANQSLTTVVGGQGLTIESPLLQPVRSYGYPVDPNNPSAPVGLQTCTSRLGKLPSQGVMICGMGPGSSGGPWLIFQDAWGMGLVAGINTYWDPQLDVMYSPWFSAQNILPIYTDWRNK